ncbi:unnamed protein product [Gadus morhua 'NCC']
MSASSAFSDEKGGSSSVGEPEYGHDPASGGIFSSDYKSICLWMCTVRHVPLGCCEIQGHGTELHWWAKTYGDKP